MLTAAKKSRIRASGGSFVIIASRYNAHFVDSMLAAASQTLKSGGAKRIEVVRVPGAFEIPAVASRLAGAKPAWSAIICLGVILRGQTDHAQQIANAVTTSIVQLQVKHGLPVIHEVLLLENEEQAVVRCLDKKHNRGAEAAQTALEMARVMESLPKLG
jgi:6,7-dimethyl-8-ribityllumazine synthase